MIHNPFHRRGPPDDLWIRCSGCHELVYRREFERNLSTCPRCSHHERVSAEVRIAMLVDPETWQEEDPDLAPGDPLGFVSLEQTYPDKLAETQAKTGLKDALLTGLGQVEGIPVRLAVCDFAFLGASMGSVVGEKVTRAVERSTRDRRPLVMVSASGGARMHEGIFSLMQMAKSSAAIGRLGQARVPYFSILADPTTGGVTASFASLGDVTLAEPGALIGFAGPRVIEQTTRQKLPTDAQRAEFLLKHGMIDAVVHRRELRATVARLLRLYTADSCTSPSQASPNARPLGGRPAGTTFSFAALQGPSPKFQAQQVERPEPPGPSGAELRSSRDPWQTVQLARNQNRPFALDYIGLMLNDFFELRGDRQFADDPAIVGGVGLLDGRTVVVVGHQKGRSTQERVDRRFGMARPEGYRKALRLMRHAEKFGFPLITLIDTPGADPTLEAEERGQAWAIAQNLMEMAQLAVPIVAVLIGEGGSGGALAIGVADRMLMLENATYSVVSPEGCASILWNDSALAPQAASALKLTAGDLREAGVADVVIPEPPEGAQEDYQHTASGVRAAILTALDELEETFGRGPDLDAVALLGARFEKYRRMGLVIEGGPPTRPS